MATNVTKKNNYVPHGMAAGAVLGAMVGGPIGALFLGIIGGLIGLGASDRNN